MYNDNAKKNKVADIRNTNACHLSLWYVSIYLVAPNHLL